MRSGQFHASRQRFRGAYDLGNAAQSRACFQPAHQYKRAGRRGTAARPFPVFHIDAQGQQTLCAVMQQTLVPVAQIY